MGIGQNQPISDLWGWSYQLEIQACKYYFFERNERYTSSLVI